MVAVITIVVAVALIMFALSLFVDGINWFNDIGKPKRPTLTYEQQRERERNIERICRGEGH